MFFFMKNHPRFFSDTLTAKVEDTILLDHPGKVKFQASFWRAKLFNVDNQVTLSRGQIVTVVGREGLTLLVKPQ